MLQKSESSFHSSGPATEILSGRASLSIAFVRRSECAVPLLAHSIRAPPPPPLSGRVLLRHDKPLHRTAQADHLKHVPAYLKDPSIVSGERSFLREHRFLCILQGLVKA